MATYPANPNLPQGTNSTAVNPENWNTLIDNINAIGADLIDARGDGQVFPGTPHTSGQCNDLNDILQAIKHILVEISGEINWYDDPAGTLKAHTHAVGQGGLIPWSSLGTSNARKIEYHPQYSGAIETTSLHGSSVSGNNDVTITTGEDVVSNVARHHYEGKSNQTALNDKYISLRFTLPIDFNAWSATAIQIEYKTESALSNDCHVDVYVYKSGVETVVASSENNANVNWSIISIAGSALGSWAANNIVELYIKLESRSGNFVRAGKISLNYTS